jgi:hypothetical protein
MQPDCMKVDYIMIAYQKGNVFTSGVTTCLVTAQEFRHMQLLSYVVS